MLIARAVCLSVVIVNYPLAAQGQDVSKVIERYIEAIGGKKAIENIASTDVSGSVSSADGRSGVFTQHGRRPHLFYVSMSWGDSRWRAGFNGRSAWQDDSLEGVRTLYGEAASRVRAEAGYAGTHFLLSEKVNRVTETGRDEVRGHRVIVAVALTADGTKRTLFFDANSHLLVKDEQQTGAGMEERFFDDYRPVDRVMEPHRIEWRRNGETFRIVVERITHNASVDGRLFDVPAPAAEPPLDIDTVLSAAGRNEQSADSRRASYAYTQSLTIRLVDGRGRVSQRQGSAFEVFHLGGQPVGRMIRRMDGQPLSEAERRRENERVERVVREYERQRLSGQPVRLEQGEFSAGYALRDLWGSLVLRVPVMTTGWFPAYRRISDFSNIRRERISGSALVVMEFQPKAGVAPNGDVERQASTMAGTLWIDEASQQVIRIDASFVENYESIVQGSSVWMEQTLVDDEAWLPARIETNLRRSLGFGALAQPLVAVQFTDYKKFGVETDSTVTPPDRAR